MPDADWEFVETDSESGYSSWWHRPDGQLVQLTPQRVVQLGLTEQMREALSAQGEAESAAEYIDSEESTESPTREQRVGRAAVLEGVTQDGWSWTTAEENGELVICVSNKLAVQARARAWLDGQGLPPLALQQAAVPLDVLAVIVDGMRVTDG
jgi:hypothetical protein